MVETKNHHTAHINEQRKAKTGIANSIIRKFDDNNELSAGLKTVRRFSDDFSVYFINFGFVQ